MALTATEIQKAQGTRLSETAPWESYGNELGVAMTPELAAQVDEYAKKHYVNGKVSSHTQEVLAEQKEANDGLAQQYQWLKPEEYADYAARIGRVLTHGEFITALRKADVICHYKQHPHPDKAILFVARNYTSDAEIACWVQIGQMPELSMMHFDDHGVPLAERRRGWRTCLLQLILKGMISEEKANKYFGRPRSDAAFDRYNSLLHAFRNAGSSLGE